MKYITLLILILYVSNIQAQHVGVQTTMPDAPMHIWSSGQVNTPGGLFLLGERTEANLQFDFNRIQSLFNGNPLTLRIQPDGGNVGINTPFPSPVDFPLQVDGSMGISGFLYHIGDIDTYFRFQQDDARIQAGGLQNLVVRSDQVILGHNSNFKVDLNTGNIGIDDISPDYKLDVNGDISLNEHLVHNGDADTYLDFDPDLLRVYAGGKNLLTVLENLTSIVALGASSNADVILNDDVYVRGSDGQVGIGESSPLAKLHIDSDANEDAFRVQINGSTKMVIDENGNSGVGNTGNFTPVTNFHVRHNNGDIETRGLSIENTSSKRWHFYVNSNNNLILYGDNALHGTFLWGLGDYVPFSDLRMKKNIKVLPAVLDRVMQLNPAAYQMHIEEGETAQFGFIAQEVKNLFPENVRYIESLDRYVVLYKGMSVLAIKSIQEQQEEIDTLKNENQEFKARLERLERMLSSVLATRPE